MCYFALALPLLKSLNKYLVLQVFIMMMLQCHLAAFTEHHCEAIYWVFGFVSVIRLDVSYS